MTFSCTLKNIVSEDFHGSKDISTTGMSMKRIAVKQ